MTEETAQDIGRRIKHHRNRRGLTQQALADGSGVTQAYIAMLEGGANYPSLVTVRRIADALDVGVAELMEDR